MLKHLNQECGQSEIDQKGHEITDGRDEGTGGNGGVNSNEMEERGDHIANHRGKAQRNKKRASRDETEHKVARQEEGDEADGDKSPEANQDSRSKFFKEHVQKTFSGLLAEGESANRDGQGLRSHIAGTIQDQWHKGGEGHHLLDGRFKEANHIGG